MRALAEHPYMVLAQRVVTAMILGVASYACTMIVADHDGIADMRGRLGVIEERLTVATTDRYTASDAVRDQKAQQLATQYIERRVADEQAAREGAMANHETRIERLEGKR